MTYYLNRRAFLAAVSGGVVFPVVGMAATRGTLFKSPGCECCDGHARHLQSFGFELAVVEANDLDGIKATYAIPTELAGCHTIIIGDRIVEGHVPGDIARRFLANPGEFSGVALAGMPDGSPGMGGRKTGVFRIIAFGPKGQYLYASR